MRSHGTTESTPTRAIAGLAFLIALGMQIMTIGRTFRGLVQNDVAGCLLYTALAVGLSLTLPVFWTLSHR